MCCAQAVRTIAEAQVGCVKQHDTHAELNSGEQDDTQAELNGGADCGGLDGTDLQRAAVASAARRLRGVTRGELVLRSENEALTAFEEKFSRRAEERLYRLWLP